MEQETLCKGGWRMTGKYRQGNAEFDGGGFQSELGLVIQALTRVTTAIKTSRQTYGDL